jgi:Tol biopolymer transport system component
VPESILVRSGVFSGNSRLGQRRKTSELEFFSIPFADNYYPSAHNRNQRNSETIQASVSADAKTMKKITLSIPDEIYIEALVWAARHNTSVSAMVRDILKSVSKERPFRAASTPSTQIHTPSPPFSCESVKL